MASENFQYVLI
jgi:hypothetical protein